MSAGQAATADRRFEGKRVLVTGAGSGLGMVVAEAFARQGASVVLSGRSAEKLSKVKAAVEERGGTALAVPTDIRQTSDVEGLFKVIESEWETLDIVVNNAGMWATGLVGELDESTWQDVVETNLTGTWRCLRGAINLMLQSSGGVITNISSVVGRGAAVPGTGAYGATKAGIETLTRTAAREYIQRGIRINTVSPGAFDTPMSLLEDETEQQRADRFGEVIPIGRIGELDEIADSVLWVCSDEASFFVGHEFVLDGGFSA